MTAGTPWKLNYSLNSMRHSTRRCKSSKTSTSCSTFPAISLNPACTSHAIKSSKLCSNESAPSRTTLSSILRFLRTLARRQLMMRRKTRRRNRATSLLAISQKTTISAGSKSTGSAPRSKQIVSARIVMSMRMDRISLLVMSDSRIGQHPWCVHHSYDCFLY